MSALDGNQGIPEMVFEVEVMVRGFMQRHDKHGYVRVIPHPEGDIEGVLVKVSGNGMDRRAKLTVREMDYKFRRLNVEREIEGFVRRELPPASGSPD